MYGRSVTAALLAATLGVSAGQASAQGPGSGGAAGATGPLGGGPGTMMMTRFDENGDGRITIEEFRAGHEQRFVSIDKDGDGKVTFEEFQAAPKPGRQARMQRMFQSMDANGDGSLSRDELDRRADVRFARFDVDGDGVISAEEIAEVGGNWKPRTARTGCAGPNGSSSQRPAPGGAPD
jgi:Ca2+-binding EF-hand superfamily protein